MKIYTTLILLFIFSTSFSQNTTADLIIKDSFLKNLNAVVDQYSEDGNTDNDNIIIQNKLLNERLNQAFNQNVFSSSDLVNNASAFGINQNEEKTNVSINGNIKLNKKNTLFLKVGGNASGSGSFFNLYDDDEWQNSVGGNIGLIWKIGGSGFTGEAFSKLKYNKAIRKVYIKDSIMGKILGFTPNSYKKIRKEYMDNLNCIFDKSDKKCKKSDSVYKKVVKKNYAVLLEYEKWWKKLELNYRKKGEKKELDFSNYQIASNVHNDNLIDSYYDSLLANENTKDRDKLLKEKIEEVAYIYDKKNVANTGYTLHWLDFNARFNNNTYNFSEKSENIKSETLEAFNTYDAQKTGINRLNTVISGNYNYTRNSKNVVIYGQIGLRFNSGSFLNSNLINGKAIVSETLEEDDFSILDEDGLALGNFNNITNNLQYGSFDGYIAFYFGKKKNFGFNLSATHNYKIKIPDNTFYENNYTILGGPIFRVPKKDNDTGLTFGVDVGFADAVYKTKATDNFVARVRVGIPLKLHNIGK